MLLAGLHLRSKEQTYVPRWTYLLYDVALYASQYSEIPSPGKSRFGTMLLHFLTNLDS